MSRMVLRMWVGWMTEAGVSVSTGLVWEREYSRCGEGVTCANQPASQPASQGPPARQPSQPSPAKQHNPRSLPRSPAQDTQHPSTNITITTTITTISIFVLVAVAAAAAVCSLPLPSIPAHRSSSAIRHPPSASRLPPPRASRTPLTWFKTRRQPPSWSNPYYPAKALHERTPWPSITVDQSSRHPIRFFFDGAFHQSHRSN